MILDTLATINNSFWNSLFTDNKAFPTNFEEIHRGGQLQKADLTEGLIDAEQINAIKQQQVRPLRVIDIDPNSVDKESGWCVYGDDVLSRMFGPTQNGYGINARIDNEGASTVSGRPTPYARTLQFDIPGNWLKVEFLPARTQGQGRVVQTSLLENPVNTIPQNTNLTENNGQFFGMGEAAGSRALLLDFESVSATPLLVEDGAEFENYFSGFFLTFYQLNVRIRITIGYNSKTKQEVFKEPNLYMFGGRGLTTKSPIHPIWYSVTDREVEITNTLGIVLSASGTRNIIFNIDRPAPSTPGDGYGNALLYISSFSSMLWQATALAGSHGVYDIEILQMGIDLLYNPTNVIKRLTAFTLVCNGVGGNAGSVNGNYGVKNFSQPIRVNLRPMECIGLRWTQIVASSATARLKFNLEGYTFGTFTGSGLAGTSAPFFMNTMYSENPFPQDMDTQDLPRL